MNDFNDEVINSEESENFDSNRISHSAKPRFNLNPKMLIKICVPVIAIIIVITIICSIFTTNNEYFGYMKDNEIFISEVEAGEGEQITQDFIVDNGISSTSISDYTRMSDDNKRIFFIDKYDGSTRNLYYKDVNDSKSHKLSSDIDSYDINDNGTIVTYIKDDSDLFQHDLSAQSEKIDKNVTYFISSDDGKKVMYYKENTESEKSAKDLYLYKNGKETQKIVSNVEFVRYISDDFSEIYYVSEGTFYKLKIGKSPTKISDDVRDVVKVFDSGEAYFSKYNENSEGVLYYYDGKKECKAVVKNYYRTEVIAEENTVMVVNSTEDSKLLYKVVEEDKVYDIQHDVTTISMNNDGSEIYFLANVDSSNMLSSLYRAEIDGKIKNLKEVSKEVVYGKYASDDMYVYLKDFDYEASLGDLYCDGKLIANSVYWNSMKYSDEKDLLFFFTDKQDNNGTLNCYDDGKVRKIREDVRLDSLSVTANGEVLFINDFKNGEGILYAYKNGKAMQIDHDVSKIIVIITNEQYDLLAKSYF